jgi:hypothetical protein
MFALSFWTYIAQMNLPDKLNTNKGAHISNHSSMYVMPSGESGTEFTPSDLDSLQGLSDISSKGLAHSTITLILPTWLCSAQSPSTKHPCDKIHALLVLVHPW